MSNTVYSREYLRGVPEERKQQQFDQIINRFQYDVINSAATGKTSFMVDVNPIRQPVQQITTPPTPTFTFTDNELITAIQKRYPDCTVKYDEQWVETGRDTRKLKKGIVIDWS